MIFGIDYDGTFAADPQTFLGIIGLLEAAGHQCIIVTGRSIEGAAGDEVRSAIRGRCPIVFAGKRWKRMAAAAEGWTVDVWMDDDPEHVGPQPRWESYVEKTCAASAAEEDDCA
jgi:hypothetical protein